MYYLLAAKFPEAIEDFGSWLIGEESDAYKDAVKGNFLDEQIITDLNSQTEDENVQLNNAWLRGFFAGKCWDEDMLDAAIIENNNK